jgi:hypothetical protein
MLAGDYTLCGHRSQHQFFGHPGAENREQAQSISGIRH